MNTELGKSYAEAFNADSLAQIADWCRNHAYPAMKRAAQDADADSFGSGRPFYDDGDRFAALAHAIAAIQAPPAAECERCGGDGLEPASISHDAGDGEGEDRPCSACSA
jgi:hypothetical protein